MQVKRTAESLGCARDDKGEGSDHLSSRYRGMERAAAIFITVDDANRGEKECLAAAPDQRFFQPLANP